MIEKESKTGLLRAFNDVEIKEAKEDSTLIRGMAKWQIDSLLMLQGKKN